MGFENILKKWDKFDGYLQKKIDNDIWANRMGQFALSFTDKDGNALSDVKVSVKQISHEFKFGCTSFYLEQYQDERDAEWKNKYKQLFNYSVVPLYWDTLEPNENKPRFDVNSEYIERRPPIDTIVSFCKENNIRMKGHCLVYNSFQPDWISNDNRKLKMQIEKRITEIAERYAQDFEDLDVINEMYTIYKNCYPGNGCRNLQITDELDHEAWCFERAYHHFPFSNLFWNEGMMESFGGCYRGHRSFYYMTLKDHLSRGVKIDGIGMQYHAYCDKEKADYLYAELNPLRIIDVLEKYSDFGLPIHISEVSIPSFSNDECDEQVQAELAKRLYSLWFSQKNVSSIVWWNLADGTAFRTENRYHAGIIRNDCTPKPAFEVLDKLINKEWHTEFDSIANERLDFRGFYGDYEITATDSNGKTVTQKIALNNDTTGFDNRLCDFRQINITI